MGKKLDRRVCPRCGQSWAVRANLWHSEDCCARCHRDGQAARRGLQRLELASSDGKPPERPVWRPVGGSPVAKLRADAERVDASLLDQFAPQLAMIEQVEFWQGQDPDKPLAASLLQTAMGAANEISKAISKIKSLRTQADTREHALDRLKVMLGD